MASDNLTGPEGGSGRGIAEEHRALRRTLELLEDTTEPGAIASLLSHLQRQLRTHFAEEEGQGGLATLVEQSAPQHHVHVERLFAEHRTFESRLVSMRSALDTINREIRDVRSEVRDLCQGLREHEARENQLITDAVYTDIGPGD